MGNDRSTNTRTVQSLSELTSDPLNANTGTARGRAALAQSLGELGAGRAVLIDRHGNIIAGHKTVEEAKRLNLPLRVIRTAGDVLVAVQREDLDLVTDARAKRLAIADNRVGQLDLEWDLDILKRLRDEGLDLSPFWTDEEFTALLGQIDGQRPDENAVVEPPTTDIVRGDVLALGPHRLMCGDATVEADVKQLLDGARPVLMATDPPYGVAYPIHIIVKNGRAMLLGVVDNAGDRQIAEIRAREVRAVFAVENGLTVSGRTAADVRSN